MLKFLGKLLVIVLVTSLITAGIYFLVQNGSLATAADFREPGFDRPPAQGSFDAGPSADAQQFRGRRPPEGFRGEREGVFSLLRGLAGIIGHGLQIAVVTIIVLFLRRLISARRPALT